MKESRTGSEPITRELKAQTWMDDMDPNGSAEAGSDLELGVAIAVNRFVWTTVNAKCKGSVRCSPGQYSEARQSINATILNDTAEFVSMAAKLWEAKSREIKEQMEARYRNDL